MIAILRILLLIGLPSCTVQPTLYTRTDGTRIATLGGSLATRSKARTLSLTLPDGTILTSSGDNDETVVPRMSMMGSLIGKGIDVAPKIVTP
jgi:hypothetical protein